MLYRKVECPHCGNEIMVTNVKEEQKCCWCRRLVSVKFQRTKGRKFICKVEPMDFPESSKQFVRSYSTWEDEDICNKIIK